MPIWKPGPGRYYYSHAPKIEYHGAFKNKPPFVIAGRFASWSQAAEAIIVASCEKSVMCEAMATKTDELGSVAYFKQPGKKSHEEHLQAMTQEEASDFDSGTLHSDFFDYEIQPDEAIEFLTSGKAKLRIQYWAIIDTFFDSGGKEGEDLIRRFSSGGFRDFGKGAYNAFKESLPMDAIIVGEFVTVRFMGRLVP